MQCEEIGIISDLKQQESIIQFITVTTFWLSDNALLASRSTETRSFNLSTKDSKLQTLIFASRREANMYSNREDSLVLLSR